MSNVIKWAKPHFLHPSYWAEPLRLGTPVVSVFDTHMAWARQQAPMSAAMVALAEITLNPALRHCRIGKITVRHDA